MRNICFMKIAWAIHVNLCLLVYLVFYNIVYTKHNENGTKNYNFTWSTDLFSKKASKFGRKASGFVL